MPDEIDDILTNAFPTARWLFQPRAHDDAVAMLSQTLGPEWTVALETDCEGDVSIIALPLSDLDGIPVLYERGGQARVGKVWADEWECDQGFNSFAEAIEAFIKVATAQRAG